MVKKSDYEKVEEMRAAINVGQYIIDEVYKGAAEEAKKELKFKRSLQKYTGAKRKW